MAATTPAYTSTTPKPFLRNRGLFIFATATTAAVVAFRSRAATIKSKEEAHRSGNAPRGYISVERSGGGV